MTDEIKDWLEKANEHYEQMLLCTAKAEALIEKQRKKRIVDYERLILIEAKVE